MTKLALPLALMLVLAGCVSTPTQVSVKGKVIPAVNGLSMSCTTPHALTQDCSGFSGATFKVEHGGVKFKVAGSADGRVVLAMALPMAPNQLEAEQVHDAVLAVASGLGAKAEKTEGVAAGALIVGFVFSFDRDVYSALHAKPAPK